MAPLATSFRAPSEYHGFRRTEPCRRDYSCFMRRGEDARLHGRFLSIVAAWVEETTHRMFGIDLLQIGLAPVTDPRHKRRTARMKRTTWGPIVGMRHEPGNRRQTLA